MTATTVTLTGTAVPHPSPGRAGPGVLVRHGDDVRRRGGYTRRLIVGAGLDTVEIG